MRNFTNWLEAYMEYTSDQETVDKIHRWVGLQVIAAALERKVWMDRGHYELIPNLYVFIVGKSGLVKKSTSTGIGVKFLRELGSVNIMSDRLTAASFIEQLESSGKKFDYKKTIRSHSPIFAYASEMKVLLEEVYGSTVGLMTTLYDPLPVWNYKSKKDGDQKIYGPCINILACTTPTWLTQHIPVSEMEGGFASRIVFVVENGPPRRFIAHPKSTDYKREMYIRLLEDLRHIHELIGEVTERKDAYDWYEVWYKKHMTSIVERADDARFSGYYARKPDLVIKVATLYSIAESDNLIIDIKHFEKALADLDELEETMLSAFGHQGKNVHAQELHRINQIIQRRGEIKHSTLLSHFCQDMNHRQLQDVMMTLVNMNAVRFYTADRDVIYKTAEPKQTEQQ